MKEILVIIAELLKAATQYVFPWLKKKKNIGPIEKDQGKLKKGAKGDPWFWVNFLK